MARDPYQSITPCWLSGSGEQVPSAVGPDLLHPALLRARVKVALTGSNCAEAQYLLERPNRPQEKAGDKQRDKGDQVRLRETKQD